MQDTKKAIQGETFPSASSKMLFHATWMTGLMLPAILGLVVLYILRSRGVQTVDLSTGFASILPLTLFIEIPFVILAFIVRQIFKGIPSRNRNLWIGWNIVCLGALIGLVVGATAFMVEPMSYEGPGGFAHAVGMIMALWLFTAPLLMLWSIAGALVGGIAGALVAVVVCFMFSSRD